MVDNLPLRMLHLKNHLDQWIDESDALVEELEELANHLDENFKNLYKAKVGDAVGAIGVGCLLLTVGFGLSFVSFGASLGLSIAGGVIAGGGGRVGSGSQKTDYVLPKKRSSTENILQKYKSRVQFLMIECVQIGMLLQDRGNVDEDFPLWVSFWANMLLQSRSGLKRIVWDIIWRTALNAMRMASFADDAILTGAAVTTTAFKTIGSTAGKALHVTGGALGIMFLPFDIYTLVDSSIDVHNANSHKTSNKIREMAAEIKSGRPTKEDIDRMVKETVTSVDSLTKSLESFG